MIKQPYPYFGGKSTISEEVWKRLGDTPNFVDPFFGGGSFLLRRPHWDDNTQSFYDGSHRIETINDIDCFVSNFWRSVAREAEAVAKHADWPVNEADLHARHLWLVRQDEFRERMRADPDYYDVKIAGWWVWGVCQWIAGGWCRIQQRPAQQLPHLGNAGRGINRPSQNEIYDYFDLIKSRLRRVRVCCGDWQRVLGPTPTEQNGITAIVLDPPYSTEANRNPNIYANDDLEVAHDVRRWAIENGENPMLHIALFGYQDEHAAEMPPSWNCLPWKANGGYGSLGNVQGRENSNKERVWFSPHCLTIEPQMQQQSLLGFGALSIGSV